LVGPPQQVFGVDLLAFVDLAAMFVTAMHDKETVGEGCSNDVIFVLSAKITTNCLQSYPPGL